MKRIYNFSVFLGTSLILTGLLGGTSGAQAPYYYGTYNASDSGSDNSAPANNQPPAPSQPPVVYQPVPVYRRVPYRAPAWASPNAAALGPWPWNFDFGGGPTVVTGSNNQLNNGSNFEIGGGYNFNPRTGLVLEFMNAWLGVPDQTLQNNNAIDGDASIWAVTLNPVWRFRLSGPIGGYIIGGGGYYEREMRFDEPTTFLVQTFHGSFLANGTETVRQYDDTGGVNLGGGLTWNVGWGTKLFVEARYHYIFTSGKATQVIPITFGVRW